MSTPFEDFVNSLPEDPNEASAVFEEKIALCTRCEHPCLADKEAGPEARMLRYTKDKETGLCVNCAVTAWIQDSFLNQLLDDPKKLLWEPLQKQFAEVMQAANADMKPEEINWEWVVEHWDKPFPKTKKRRGKRR